MMVSKDLSPRNIFGKFLKYLLLSMTFVGLQLKMSECNVGRCCCIQNKLDEKAFVNGRRVSEGRLLL